MALLAIFPKSGPFEVVKLVKLGFRLLPQKGLLLQYILYHEAPRHKIME